MDKKNLLIAFIVTLLIGTQAFIYLLNTIKPEDTSLAEATQSPTPAPTPYQYYTAPDIQPKDVYLVALVGDSMTKALGPHGGKFTEKLNQLYEQHDHDILVDNYSIGSTSLLTLDERLTESTEFDDDWTYPPLLERPNLDLIIIESFAYNPLSQFERDEALRKREQILSDTLIKIEENLPHTRIVFMSTIAPNTLKFAEISANLTDEESKIQAEERMTYLQHHLDYAQTHQIPSINVYHQSLTMNGDGDLEYINPDDYIHPSAVGIEFISQKMAEFIYENELLPK